MSVHPSLTYRVEDEGRDGGHERLHGSHKGEELSLRGLLHVGGEEGAEVRVGALWVWREVDGAGGG